MKQQIFLVLELKQHRYVAFCGFFQFTVGLTCTLCMHEKDSDELQGNEGDNRNQCVVWLWLTFSSHSVHIQFTFWPHSVHIKFTFWPHSFYFSPFTRFWKLLQKCCTLFGLTLCRTVLLSLLVLTVHCAVTSCSHFCLSQSSGHVPLSRSEFDCNRQTPVRQKGTCWGEIWGTKCSEK